MFTMFILCLYSLVKSIDWPMQITPVDERCSHGISVWEARAGSDCSRHSPRPVNLTGNMVLEWNKYYFSSCFISKLLAAPGVMVRDLTVDSRPLLGGDRVVNSGDTWAALGSVLLGSIFFTAIALLLVRYGRKKQNQSCKSELVQFLVKRYWYSTAILWFHSAGWQLKWHQLGYDWSRVCDGFSDESTNWTPPSLLPHQSRNLPDGRGAPKSIEIDPTI